MIHLSDLTPAAEEGWWLLFELAEEDAENWVLVGGQMVHLLAVELGVSELARPTDDVDVIVNVRARQGATEWMAQALIERGFTLDGESPEGIGHRFTRSASGGVGKTVFDVLAPDGIGERTNVATVPPARTVSVPGGTQAFRRSELVEVEAVGVLSGESKSGLVRRPNLLGALVGKAAATGIANRENPDRDFQDAALLLAAMPDPKASAAECSRKDRERLGRLRPLYDEDHVGWASLDREHYLRGEASLRFLLDE